MRELFSVETTAAGRTKKLGQIFAQELLRSFRLGKRATVISLEGELGGGKTTFVQGMAKGFGIREKVLSPSFLIMRVFRIPSTHRSTSRFTYLVHLDAYRLKRAREILDLGFKTLWEDPRNILVVEWAQHIRAALPPHTLRIRFTHVSPRMRRIIFSL